jgi:hypothetical protein
MREKSTIAGTPLCARATLFCFGPGTTRHRSLLLLQVTVHNSWLKSICSSSGGRFMSFDRNLPFAPAAIVVSFAEGDSRRNEHRKLERPATRHKSSVVLPAPLFVQQKKQLRQRAVLYDNPEYGVVRLCWVPSRSAGRFGTRGA